MIRFQGTLSTDVYRRSLAIGGRWRWIGLVMLLLLVMIVPTPQITDPDTWYIPTFLGAIGVMILLYPRMREGAIGGAGQPLAEQVTGDADEQGVRLECAHERADLPWTTMHKVVVTPSLVSLYPSARAVRMVPRELFADEESWQVFRKLATAAARTAPGRSPSSLRMFLLWMAIAAAISLLWALLHRA